MQRLKISIICPVFNTPPAFLSAAVVSVFAEKRDRDIELILVDDCSTLFETINELQRLRISHENVKLIRTAENGGPSCARSLGIAYATYSWIGFVDADDLWPEGKLDKFEAVLKQHRDAQWIVGNYSTLGRDGLCVPAASFWSVSGGPVSIPSLHQLSGPELTRLLAKNWLPLGSSLIQKNSIVEAGGFEPNLTYGEDWLLCLRLSTIVPMHYYDESAYTLRRQGASMMHSEGRLSSKWVRAAQLARRDIRLRAIRRELRWAHYAIAKDIAMNNALNGHRLRGLSFALRAFAQDPRELGELVRYLAALHLTGPALAKAMAHYSSGEQIYLDERFADSKSIND